MSTCLGQSACLCVYVCLSVDLNVYLYLCLPVCLCVCVCLCTSVYLYVRLSLSVCLSVCRRHFSERRQSVTFTAWGIKGNKEGIIDVINAPGPHLHRQTRRYINLHTHIHTHTQMYIQCHTYNVLHKEIKPFMNTFISYYTIHT